MSGPRLLNDEDFPLDSEQDKLLTKDGKPIATADNPAIAEDLVERLNEDAHRRHEDNWSL